MIMALTQAQRSKNFRMRTAAKEFKETFLQGKDEVTVTEFTGALRSHVAIQPDVDTLLDAQIKELLSSNGSMSAKFDSVEMHIMFSEILDDSDMKFGTPTKYCDVPKELSYLYLDAWRAEGYNTPEYFWNILAEALEIPEDEVYDDGKVFPAQLAIESAVDLMCDKGVLRFRQYKPEGSKGMFRVFHMLDYIEVICAMVPESDARNAAMDKALGVFAHNTIEEEGVAYFYSDNEVHGWHEVMRDGDVYRKQYYADGESLTVCLKPDADVA